MRANVPQYRLETARSIDEALRKLGQGFRPFAGGTDLMVVFETGRLTQLNYVSLHALKELQQIEISVEEVRIGAGVTYSQIRAHEILGREFPMLGQAAKETGAIAIQNRGTIGGNVANASPAADTPPALLAYDAEVELRSPQGLRRVSYDAFHTGYKQTAARPDELISAIVLKRTPTVLFHWYRKVGTRKAQAISKICFAACAWIENGKFSDVRVGLGAVAPTVVRALGLEGTLKNCPITPQVRMAAKGAMAMDVQPIDDVRSTAAYRRKVAQNLVDEFLDAAVAFSQGAGK